MPAQPEVESAVEPKEEARADLPLSPRDSAAVRRASPAHASRAPAPPAATVAQAPLASSPAGGLGLIAKSTSGSRAFGAAKARGVLVPSPARVEPEFNTENYSHIQDNPFLSVAEQPLSTFSIDVDTASYSNARRFLTSGSLPPRDAIRVEEWVNYFGYDYPEPTGDAPFSVTDEVMPCPWEPSHRLVRIGLKGRSMSEAATPPRNLVFLIDVSGSMMPENKLPLLKRGLSLLARNLREQDSLAIAVYAGASGLALPPTSGSEQGRIIGALGSLEAGGSTNGGDGIRLAYSVARQHFNRAGINRVILATDGDFNVGTTSEGELQRLIENERKSGVFLTVLGFGEGNLKDSTMETLADKGNGNYAYIDSLAEARKVLVREAGGTLVTIAKDVKLQVEFNPARVASYKLLGYENRLLARQDFNDDSKDAGEMGAGHTVSALYEVVPKGAPSPAAAPASDPLKYQTPGALAGAARSDELLTVNIRYKAPAADSSVKFSRVVRDTGVGLASASIDFRFSAAVAEAALVLRGAQGMGSASLESARALAASALGRDTHGERAEFVSLLERARSLGQ